MIISHNHNRRVQAIIKQFSYVDKELTFEDDYQRRFSFNPAKMGFARNRIIFKFLSRFPVDVEGDPVSFSDITAKELVECEERFLALLSENAITLQIVDEEWQRLINSY